ncbi:hypothetical protein B0I35DRAFT_473127 [Stachybotrys elegans]|uniref:Uncharacterized protein n=1 Tax=Stachybotrys elegans TaxID=80388 RepID=A0A8K0WXE7_9HYPO|nr:hypothetical protein B0I35DRAFT_473127 [Stachybotrys elegans]
MVASTIARRAASKPRTAAQPWRGSHGDIWVTDLMLQQAMQRYHRAVARLDYRSHSTHPSPLEGRRRESKRRITGALHQPTPTTPFWEFAVSYKPNDFTWLPPTTLESRNSRERPKGRLSSALPWLYGEMPGPPPDVPQPMAEVMPESATSMAEATAESTINMEEPMAESTASIAESTKQQPPEASTNNPSLGHEFRQSLLQMSSPTKTQLFRAMHIYCGQVEQQLQCGQLTPEGLSDALLWAADPTVREVLQNRGHFSATDISIRRRLVDVFLEWANAQATSDRALLAYWWSLLRSLDRVKDWTTVDPLLVMDVFKNLPSEMRRSPAASPLLAEAASVMSRKPSVYTPDFVELGFLFDVVHFARKQFVELSTKMPSRGDDLIMLFTTARKSSWWRQLEAFSKKNDVHEGLGPRLFRLLMLRRFVALGLVRPSEARQFLNVEWSRVQWAKLVKKISGHHMRDQAIYNMVRAAKLLGRQGCLHGLVKTTTIPIHARVRLVTHLNDANLAWELWHSVPREHKLSRCGSKLPSWRTTKWTFFIPRLIRQSNEPGQLNTVWDMLGGYDSFWNCNGSEKERKNKVRLVNGFARELAAAPGQSYRTRLRHVLRCRWLQRCNPKGGEVAVVSKILVEMVTNRHIGSPGFVGSQGYLEWVVRLTREAEGEEKAREVYRMLSGWRATVERTRPDLHVMPLRWLP